MKHAKGEDMQSLIQKLLASFPVPISKRHYKKGEVLHQVGATTKTFYLIQSGAVGIFTCCNAKEYILRFGYAPDIVAPIDSFYRDTPSVVRIQCIQSAEVVPIQKQSLDNFLTAHPSYQSMYQEYLEHTIADTVAREVDILIDDPKIRLNRLLERSPQIFQKVPHKYIAMYLGMTPETLSRSFTS